jgi:hypothetical protein
MTQYMVSWSAVRFPWVPDEDGDLEPDERQDHDMWFGPFPNQDAAFAFAYSLPVTDQHVGWQVGVMIPPDDPIALRALGERKEVQ